MLMPATMNAQRDNLPTLLDQIRSALRNLVRGYARDRARVRSLALFDPRSSAGRHTVKTAEVELIIRRAGGALIVGATVAVALALASRRARPG